MNLNTTTKLSNEAESPFLRVGAVTGSTDLTHGSLFSDIGGFEIGAERAGIPTIWNCEFENYQSKILKKIDKNAKQYRDIREAKITGYVDIISGGFPCQDISVAGKMEGIKGDRLFTCIQNGEVDNAVMVQIFEGCADYLNLKTLTNYANAQHISYNGAKHRKKQTAKIDGVLFVVDND